VNNWENNSLKRLWWIAFILMLIAEVETQFLADPEPSSVGKSSNGEQEE